MTQANAISPVGFFSNFKEITKFRLSISVVFSSMAGYLLGANVVNFNILLMLAVGGYCLVGASNAYNQIIEKNLDTLMERTKNRPLPARRMTVNTAFIIAVVLTLAGIGILYAINPKTALFGALSVFIYTSIYTPLKTVTPFSVFVGAIPGAIPFMLGWVAASNQFGIEPGTLFMIQFFWQFPHFWAIGWFLHEDYQKAGFKMLPTKQPDKGTAMQIVAYTVWTIITSILPFFGFTGTLKLSVVGTLVMLVLGGGLLYFSLKLFKDMTTAAARTLMLASVLYITLLQIVYIADKFLR